MRIRRPSHATVVAYLALLVALGGSAYAVSKVGTNDLKRSAVTSPKIADETIRGRDVAKAAVGTRQLSFRPVIRHQNAGECDPAGGVPTECARFGIRLERPGGVFVVAGGGQFSVGGPAAGECRIDVGAGGGSSAARPGETASINTDSGATNGFTLTFATSGLRAGPHSVAMLCTERSGDVRIQPSLGAIALPGAIK